MTDPEPTHKTKETVEPPTAAQTQAEGKDDHQARDGAALRSRRARLIGAGALVLALLAGLLVWLSGGDDKAEAKGDRRPFDKAVANLAVARGLRYKDTAIAGITARDVTVTASGKKFGTTGYGKTLKNLESDVLRIDGKTFTRHRKAADYEKDLLPKGEKDGPGRWVVNPTGGTKLLDEVLQQFLSPKELAGQLHRALNQVDRFPEAAAPGAPPLIVSGVPALRVDTSAGRLVVTKKPPYRVLRLEPYDLHDMVDGMKDSVSQGATPSIPPPVEQGPLKEGDSKGMELTPLTGPESDEMFDRLEEYIEKLGDAVDDNVDFTLNTGGDLQCGGGGCSVNESFTGSIVPREKGVRIRINQVTAVLTATVTINGKPAGQCSSPPTVVRFSGNMSSGNLSCEVPGAGPVYEAERQRLKSMAEAESRASGGRPVPYRISNRAWAEIDARAIAAGDVEKLTEEVQREREEGA